MAYKGVRMGSSQSIPSDYCWLVLAGWTIVRVTSAELQVLDRRLATRARLARALEDVASVLGAALDTKQIALSATQRNAFLKHSTDRVVQPR